mmetsp:Transcript_117145/g.318025  ORF Transcript_117145/g.318025 Transcript_117145/m.318025 type:complete len:273 (-) Transcript_117145:974-1792(-)
MPLWDRPAERGSSYRQCPARVGGEIYVSNVVHDQLPGPAGEQQHNSSAHRGHLRLLHPGRSVPRLPAPAGGDELLQVRTDNDADEEQVGPECQQDQQPGEPRALRDLLNDEVDVRGDDKAGYGPADRLPARRQHVLTHHSPVRVEVEHWQQREGQLHRLQDVQPLVRSVAEVWRRRREQGDGDSGPQRNGPREQRAHPHGDPPLHETLHDVLPRKGTSHRGRLPGGQNAESEEGPREVAVPTEELHQRARRALEADLAAEPGRALCSAGLAS